MFYLKTEQTFDSAHFLQGYDGKCRNLHGHCWRVVAEIKAETLRTDPQMRGMILDFSDLKTALKSLCDELDHALIYEAGSLQASTTAAFRSENFRTVEVPFRPTAENFAKYFYDRLKEAGLPVHRTEVYETAENCAVYEE